MIILDGHGDRLELRLERGDWEKFRRDVEALVDVAGGVARFFRISIRPPHWLDIPPRGALFRLRANLTYLPCCHDASGVWDVGELVGGLLLSERDSEAVWVVAPILAPQVKLWGDATVCKVTLSPLPISFLLPYPIPDLEFTDDLEQMLPAASAQLAGLSADMEGLEQAPPDAHTMVYRRYLRYYVRQMSAGFRLLLARIVIYHALLRKEELLSAPPPSTVATPPRNILANRLMALVDTPELKWERWVALRLLYDANPNSIPLSSLSAKEFPNIEEIVVVMRMLREYAGRRI